jgi:hypothetical protein
VGLPSGVMLANRPTLVQALNGRKDAAKVCLSILQRSMSRRRRHKWRLHVKARQEDRRTVGLHL